MRNPTDRFQCRPRQQPRGVKFRVWAPYAKQVDLIIQPDKRVDVITMTPEEWGYFVAEDIRCEAGDKYGYRLNNGPLRPDPCTLWQPDGIHRASGLYFPKDFPWTDQNWQGIPKEQSVFYELHVGTFTPEGTFEAIIPRLPQLKELGITTLELMPVSQFSGTRNWGYDGVHLFATQNSYGGPQGLQKLVDAAHAAGLAVFLDVVYNHLGPEGNYIAEFGPYYSRHHSTNWGPAFNYDGEDSDPVRHYVLENVQHWLEDFHLDGLRLDAVHAMFDNRHPHILQEIKQTAEEVAARTGRPNLIIAESLMNDIRMIQPRTQGGYQLDAEWNEDFHHAIFAYLTGEQHGKYIDYGQVHELPEVLEKTYVLSGKYSHFRKRRWGRPVEDFSGDYFVVGIQNHDHIGNRAHGERLSVLLSPPEQRLAASLMLLSPFLPLLFMGEEYGETQPFQFFCSFQDPQLIKNVQEGRRRDYEFTDSEVPDPQSTLAFEASRLTWTWPENTSQAGLRKLYQDLLTARRRWPALQHFATHFASLWPDKQHAAVLVMERRATEEDHPQQLTCWFNLTKQTQPLPSVTDGPAHILFRSESPRYTGSQEQSTDPAQEKLLQPFECLVQGSADALPLFYSQL